MALDDKELLVIYLLYVEDKSDDPFDHPYVFRIFFDKKQAEAERLALLDSGNYAKVWLESWRVE